MSNEIYMRRAVELAKLGIGAVDPNPLVGAVIVKNGRIIGEGYHICCGDLHAERNAFANCTEDPANADLYVTLEPCCHQGRTSPCTDIILEKRIRRVFIGSHDPNPKVCGKGTALLRQNGVEVIEEFLQEECDALNPIFFHYITKKMPYVAIKYAITADGKLATITGASQWITGEKSRQHVHQLRHQYMGILVGIGTVLADDPMLNCRIPDGRNPVRIICDSHLRLPLESRICKTASEIKTIVAYTKASAEKITALAKAGIQLWQMPEKNGHVFLPALMEKLAEAEISSILAEGGGEIHFSLLEEHLVQKVYVYFAPKIFGGTNAKTPVGGAGISFPNEAFRLKPTSLQYFNEDLLLEFDVLEGGETCSQD
ncbi:MAG: bifunctional diaminohydroxyphosphoribosylaminopyrimidine deaminase/5-amino-6-(5-phosphoribosylamino)uracil reductase RibD [Anaerotignum sp.]|nr:bifunctional diaminohydroxyphosphoribosylaminopyrimidine deaminase/5-amino-6-(5-phosphoribosylamino)uracil reductase RibD [Anaerotignum sp.]